MKRKEYITPFVEFSNIELESDMLEGSPENNGSTALDRESNPMGNELAPTVWEQGDGIPEVE